MSKNKKSLGTQKTLQKGTNHNYYNGHVRFLRDTCNEYLAKRISQGVFLTLVSVEITKLKLVSEKSLQRLLGVDEADGEDR